MKKKIIYIDEDLCVGCGLCVNTCQESAIELINNKAVVTHEDYCDGLGNCLPVCPTNAITFIEKTIDTVSELPITDKNSNTNTYQSNVNVVKTNEVDTSNSVLSNLKQWPVQIKLVLENASFFDNAHLLIAADCSAFSYKNFHEDYMKNKVTLIGCPKLDDTDYTVKIKNIISNNNIKSVTIVRMEVPCCAGIEIATVNALQQSQKMIPWNIVTIRTDGSIVEI